jgi:beta-N-acetylhexosaminidase
VNISEAAELVGPRLLRTFEGTEPTPHVLDAIAGRRAGGVTLFRAKNVASPAQVRELCGALQAARPAGDPPLVIALDQEGGQLQAVGEGATAWPGNLALGATRSEELARRVGRAIASEMAAMGVTLLLAPVCDLLHRETATNLGTRPFGDDPAMAGRLAAAMTRGIQEAGVAATLKHFPGHGSAVGDSHHVLPVLRRDLTELEAEELVPFRAAIAAGARVVMPGHLAVPALTDGRAVPATVAPEILRGLLRGRLGFAGVTVSDALDMSGAGASDRIDVTVVEAAGAGMDLLLMLHDPATEDLAFNSLVRAAMEGRLDADALADSRGRIMDLRRWLGSGDGQPPLDVIDSRAHRGLAREVAERSVTLVRDRAGSVPLRPGPGARVAIVAPAPVDLTPAESASYLRLTLADALRGRGLHVDEVVAPLDPTPAEVAALAAAVRDRDVVIVGTFDGFSFAGQADLVRAVVGAEPSGAGAGRSGAQSGRSVSLADRPVVAVALRAPFDLERYPEAPLCACTYGIQPPQMEAFADALLGRIPFAGTLPVTLEKPS